jgi:hypothetical protein
MRLPGIEKTPWRPQPAPSALSVSFGAIAVSEWGRQTQPGAVPMPKSHLYIAGFSGLFHES